VKKTVVIVDPQPATTDHRPQTTDIPPPVSHLNAPEQMPTTPAPQRRAPRIPTRPPDTPATQPVFVAPEPRPPVTPHPDEFSDPNPSGITQQPLWEALQEMENGGDEASDVDDELLPEAIALVRSLNKASTSLLQRRFRIGYTRAARLMDALEDQGIIGPPTGTSKAREVYGANGSPAEDNEAGEVGATDAPEDKSE
jgi:S-DNA-T family DNA segregation ATPase FtsK/SpoIIIE